MLGSVLGVLAPNTATEERSDEVSLTVLVG